MKKTEESRRIRERVGLSLPVRVEGKDGEAREWTEMTRLIDVTPFGARFAISRPTEPGRLLHMILAMPRQLRCYDHVEDQYRIWGLVRNVKMVSGVGEKLRYEVGVAFIGKRPPASYATTPDRRYDVAPSPMESGLWNLRENIRTGVARKGEEEWRVDTRHQIPVTVLVEALDESGEISASEETVTENVSRRGAAVFTTLEIMPGRFVRLRSAQYQISVLAAVRVRRKGPDGIMRLHLEFVDREWPLD